MSQPRDDDDQEDAVLADALAHADESEGDARRPHLHLIGGETWPPT